MKLSIFSLLIIGVFLTLPNVSFAYNVTDNSARRINDSMAIFAIQYQFGHGKYDFYMPVGAIRNQPLGTKNNRIGFEVIKNGEVVKDEGTAFGVVLSSVPYSEDEYYRIPAGTALRMTLFVVLEVDKDSDVASYRIAVTDLPFYRGENKDYFHLNQFELANYVSPTKSLNLDNQPPD